MKRLITCCGMAWCWALLSQGAAPDAKPVAAAAAASSAPANKPIAATKSDAPDNERAAKSGPLPGHSLHGEAFDEGPRQAARLIPGCGKIDFKITTKSPEAQQFFNQGVGQLHGFWYFEAERSFRQASLLDPAAPMPYWGMTLANINNEKRAKQFIKQAVERKNNAGAREQRWIDAWAAFYRDEPSAAKGKPSTSEKDRDTKRRQQLVRALEDLVNDDSKDPEAKAMLVVQIWQNKDKGLPITSQQAVDAVLDQLFAIEPMHPAHHYRIHLWDDGRASRATSAAALCGPSAPGIAHMWHMPGHTYAKLNRYHDQAWQQEAASRVDHAYMLASQVMPDEIHNYAHNEEWLIRTLNLVGRAHEAAELAKALVANPCHPRYNPPGRDKGSTRFGRRRLLDTLVRYELWNELIALSDTPYLEVRSERSDEIPRLRALGTAYYATGNVEAGDQQLATLETWLAEERKKAADAKAAEAKKKPSPTASKPAGKPASNSGTNKGALAPGESSESKAAAAAKPATAAKPAPDSKSAGESKPAAKTDLVKSLEPAIDELKGYRAAAQDDWTAAVAAFERAKSSRAVLSRANAEAGRKEQAEKLAQQEADADRNDAYALANLVDILTRVEKHTAAKSALDRLRTVGSEMDLDLPVVARLQPALERHALSADWRTPAAPAKDTGERPALESLGPFVWTPPPAPPLPRLPTGGERSIGLDDYRGKPVVLIFYLGKSCLHCVEQMKRFAPQASAFRDSGIELLGVSTDSVEALKSSVEAFDSTGTFPFPLVSDAELTSFRAYRAYDDFEKMPLHATVLVDGQGRILWQDIGAEPFMDVEMLLKEARRQLQLRTPR